MISSGEIPLIRDNGERTVPRASLGRSAWRASSGHPAWDTWTIAGARPASAGSSQELPAESSVWLALLTVTSLRGGGVQHVLGTMNIPALRRSSGGHYFATVKVPSYGSRMLILTIDPDNLVPEPIEGDNVMTKAYSVSIESCPKV